MIAAAATGAALALSGVADRLGVTVRLFGTPAEESGGGKIVMLERGVFGTHAVMAAHPARFDVDYVECQPLACAELLISYTGRRAPVASADATSAINRLTGLGASESVSCTLNGTSAATVARYSLLAATAGDRDLLAARVTAYAEAAAAAHGCAASVSYAEPPYSHFTSDPDLERCYAANLRLLGRTPRPHPADEVYSTDLANLSLIIPAISPSVGIDSGSAVCHDAGFAPACITLSAGRRGPARRDGHELDGHRRRHRRADPFPAPVRLTGSPAGSAGQGTNPVGSAIQLP